VKEEEEEEEEVLLCSAIKHSDGKK